MLKKTVMAAACFALLGSPALAQSFSPAPSNTNLSGVLTLTQSTTLDCNVNVSVSIDASGNAAVTSRSFSPGDFLCGTVVNPAGTWTIEAGPGTNAVTLNVGASSILGSCSGTVQASWNNSTGALTFNNVSIPGSPSACNINGTLTSSPQVSIVP